VHAQEAIIPHGGASFAGSPGPIEPARSGVSLTAVPADARAAHMMRWSRAITTTATAQMPARQTMNTMPRCPLDLSKGTSVAALTTASSATPASNITTYTIEREPSLVIRGTIPEAIRLSAWNRNYANFALTAFYEVGFEVRLVASCLLWRGRSRCS
jgi:hypothetical protein